MNIFYLDKDIKKCVRYHCDKHVIKMVLEYAQILCTAHRILDKDIDSNELLYKSSHINHPSVKWARESLGNYKYLYKLFINLSKEYTYRYGKIHKTYLKLSECLKEPPININKGSFTEPPQCMYSELKGFDTVESYRNYYKLKSTIFKMTYKNRKIPLWFNTNE